MKIRIFTPRSFLIFFSLLFFKNVCFASSGPTSEEDSLLMTPVWVSDQGNGTYINPIIYADYSDPDVVKVGDDFYMVASSFNCIPALPVLQSKDLVNWTIIGHVFYNQTPESVYDLPGHGLGVWAPSIRYHDGTFFVCYGDPDYGIYMAKATDPEGPWDHKLIHPAKGWIDPCPFWDDNDSAYIVHAYANSRIGFKSVLTLRRMSRDGEAILGDSTMLFDGRLNNNEYETVEGPKMYKRNGYYYVFAPYGGVTYGKQAVFKATDIFGPYKDTTVLEQGSTSINGPHQGGFVELESGESWFIHFQDKEPYGRITHLQPIHWKSDWPFIGEDYNGDSIGEPVLSYTKPDVGATYPIIGPQTSDKFDTDTMGLQWQWHGNVDSSWWSLSENPGSLRLFAAREPVNYKNLWQASYLFMQKFPAPVFSMTAKINIKLADNSEKTGLVVMGNSYHYIGVFKTDTACIIKNMRCLTPASGTAEQQVAISASGVPDSVVYLRLNVASNASCRFSFSFDGIHYSFLGSTFTAAEGKWIGAKAGLFCSRPNTATGDPGYIDVDWYDVSYYYNRLPAAVNNSSPADKDSLPFETNLTLSWTGDAVFTDSFFVYLDTVDNPQILVKAQKTASFKPTGLLAGKTYYWQVNSKNSKGTTQGPVWSFYFDEAVGENDLSALAGYSFGQNKPNPFSDYTVFTFSLPETKNIQIVLYDASGRKLKIVEKGIFEKGSHEITFRRGDLPSGIYVVKLEIEDKSIARKIIIR
ncbi:MAG: family 43 glycosylhydrolase [Bacteroidales bacterium]|nr:family 43 glycosylhydrolase [Bacteroidales bacterium]